VQRAYSIKGRKIFQTIYKFGERKNGQSVRIITLPDKKFSDLQIDSRVSPKVKIAIVINKKYGKAWERNKAKRRVRAICSGFLKELQDGFYIVINPKNESKRVSYQKIESELKFLLKKSGLIK